MEYLKVRNWSKWQTYRRDRGQPPWIKVHRALARDPNWVALSDAQRGQLVALWMLAADRDGRIPDCPDLLKKLCYMDAEPDLDVFILYRFIEPRRQADANPTSDRRHDDPPETETEAETEKNRRTLVASDDATASIRDVLDSCNEITGRALTLTAGRQKKIKARLRDGFAPEQLVAAMQAAHADPFYRGENDRGRRYDDPETVFKSTESTEKHLEHLGRVRNGKALPVALSKGERRMYGNLKAIEEWQEGGE